MLTRFSFSHVAPSLGTLLRGAAVTCISSALIIGSTGCASQAPNDETSHFNFRAGENLLKPSSSQTFVLQPDPAENEHEPSESFASPYAVANTEVAGSLVVKDGLITHVDLTASVESPNDVRFELTSPTLFERRGELLETVVAHGTLSTDSATYHNVKVTFTPDVDDDVFFMDTAIEVPESFTSGEVTSSTSIHFRLLVAPESQSEATQAEPGTQDSEHESDTKEATPQPPESDEEADPAP